MNEYYWIGKKEYIRVGSEWHEVVELPKIYWDGRVLDLYHHLGDILMRFPDAQLDDRLDWDGDSTLCITGTTEPVTNEKTLAALDKQVEKKKQAAAAMKKKKAEQERREYVRLAKKYGPKQ